ncbi:glycosyltransferase [Pelistega sp. NLN82]|uniref:Glycosyltransferase n=1 Tax=Pelistega ratti TaxID=2652177 RepID=A0A6L9Y8S0_9BURK|nr:glycosyltransferase [Pelistega ratti]NEN76575.1 glycosyltransferase [Pelistega ratti]
MQQVNLLVDRSLLMKDVVMPMNKQAIQANLKCVPIVHNSHLKNRQDISSGLGNLFTHLAHLTEFDAVIVLTEKQKNDLTSIYGDVGNIYVIPHAVNFYPTPVPFSQRIKGKAVAIARLSPEKGHERMIRLFSEVVKKLPYATLDIYGHGNLEKDLKALIQSLNMQDHIRILPFTNNVYEKFSQASVSLLTSRFEGFALVVQESLASGCPMISFDIRYGPSAMIENGYNGFLTDRLNDNDFIEKVVETLSDTELNQRLSANAYTSMQKFSEEKVAQHWRHFFDNALFKHNEIPTLPTTRALAVLPVLSDGTIQPVLEQHNLHTPIPPASTTKILTALIALESGMPLDTHLTVLESDIRKGSGNNLKAGDIITLENALYNMLLPSSNTSAQLVARCVSEYVGTDFISSMNEKAQSIGMTNSTFVNPTGLAQRGQQSTPYDLTLLCIAASKNEQIQTIWWTTKKQLSIKGENKRKIEIVSLLDYLHNYSWFLGGKSGTLVPYYYHVLSWIQRPNGQHMAVFVSSYSAEQRLTDTITIQKYIEKKYTE